MLALQRLLRSRPKWSYGTAHIFWYMMDEHMYFWCHPGILCSQAPMNVSSNVLTLNLSIATQEISKSLGRGKHTTRGVELYD